MNLELYNKNGDKIDYFDYTFKEHIDEFNKYFEEENITNLEQQQHLVIVVGIIQQCLQTQQR
jgi:hypothetical protein